MSDGDQFWLLPEGELEELGKGYGLGAYYKNELVVPAAKAAGKAVKTARGKLTPVPRTRTTSGPKHKKIQQLGF